VFSEFLARVLDEGRIVFRSGEVPRDRPTPRDVATLAEAFGRYALTVAGPPIGFEPAVACEAAELVRRAAWALVDRGERAQELRRQARMHTAPTTPAQHLSADLLLRYLPQLLRRARALDPTDALVDILGDVLRRWPLSGALSDIEEAPTGPTDFGGHPGLLLLYAERLDGHDRPAWRPGPSSPAFAYRELVAGPESSNRGNLVGP
jgi:hypothetical protein